MIFFSYTYRTEDNKENTFEVSLFAELFNEMLMRDSGFKLYKAICVSAEKSSVENLDKSKNADDAEKKSEDTKSEDTNEKKTEVEKTKTKVLTKDRDLLLACSYFDLGHCGYFETKDLEDILTTMNLSLSRAQIKKLVTKVTNGKDFHKKIVKLKTLLYDYCVFTIFLTLTLQAKINKSIIDNLPINLKMKNWSMKQKSTMRIWAKASRLSCQIPILKAKAMHQHI